MKTALSNKCEKPIVYLGIDNGLKGGIVAISSDGLMVKKWVMPCFDTMRPATTNEKKKKKVKVMKAKEVDTKALLEIIDSLGNRERIKTIFEHCPYHADNASTLRSMAISAGKIFGLLETRGLACRRVLSHEWQRSLLGKISRGETKSAAEAKAKELWPDECWLKNSRCRIAHDGMIDAALIAEYGRRVELTESKANEG